MAKSRSKSGEHDAIELLLEDHKNVNKLFKDFEKADREDTEALQQLVSTACRELQIHSMLEKELFYPAVRDQIEKDEDEDMLNEADVEHQVVDQLIETLEAMEADDAMYPAYFTVLSEYVQHHVKEEEKEMFPRVKKLKGLDLDALGEEMMQRRHELAAELGSEEDAELQDLEDDEETSASADSEELEEVDDKPSRSRGKR